MPKILRFVVLALLLVLIARPDAHAQSNQFRDSRAHLGVAAGWFTYHGPIDLLQRRTTTNYVRDSKPAAVFLGSFPLVTDRFFFRGMVALTNFDTKKGRRLVGTGENEFLTRFLLLFEPEVVMTLAPGSKSRILPYVFTGFGGMVADPFNANDAVDFPGSGIPGPERSSFYLPVGAGIDLALTGCFSVFAEASWRFDLNYVFRNERNYDPHNTSLVMGGIRIGLCGKKQFRTPAPKPIPAPLAIPAYSPALPASPQMCTLVELNSVYFAVGSISLSAEARQLLDENVEALRISPMCCVEIVGWADETDRADTATRVARQRAEAVYQYYVSHSLPAERFKVTARGMGTPCGKDEEGPGCARNRRVESKPYDCSQAFRSY